MLLGISIHGNFGGKKRQEGVGIKARRGLQSNRNKKIGRIPYAQVYPDLIMTGINENTDNFSFFAGKIPGLQL